MKKTFYILYFGLILVACTSKKSATSTVSTEPTEQQVTAVQAKFPGANMAELKQGHDLYYGTCTKCHGAKKITNESAEAWPGILTKMAKKAKITDEQKNAIHKYVTGVLLTSTK